jgi:hypothetical protein
MRFIKIKLYGRQIAGFITFGIGGQPHLFALQTLWTDVPIWFFGEKASAFLVER